MLDIRIIWNEGNNGFNVGLALSPKDSTFLLVKGCRVVNGPSGPFIGYPARKDDTGQWWSHVWGSDEFNAAVLAKVQASVKAPSSTAANACK